MEDQKMKAAHYELTVFGDTLFLGDKMLSATMI